MRPGSNSPRRQQRQLGFSYLLVLFMIALAGIALAAAGTLWSAESRREKEKELLFAGEQYRQALRNYYLMTPGEPKTYPKTLEELILDTRHPVIVRHLRKLYTDPVTRSTEWGLIRDPATQGIMGVYSLSPERPIKQKGFDAKHIAFDDADQYSDWRFEIAGTTNDAARTAPSNSKETAKDNQ
jgi:type II secretory pathway pseudopilin PulG